MSEEASHQEDVVDQAAEDLEFIRQQDLQNIRAYARAAGH